jgi:hypothetical protein
VDGLGAGFLKKLQRDTAGFTHNWMLCKRCNLDKRDAAGACDEFVTSRTITYSRFRNGEAIFFMKPTRSNNNRQGKQGLVSKPRPEIRDNLDSRSRIQGRFVGDKSKKGDRKPQK